MIAALLLLLHAATAKVLHHRFPVPVRRDILRSHNERRIRVAQGGDGQPRAANMRRMVMQENRTVLQTINR